VQFAQIKVIQPQIAQENKVLVSNNIKVGPRSGFSKEEELNEFLNALEYKKDE
jgi:hypothetical protein